MRSRLLFIPQHMASLKEMILISNGLNEGDCIFYITFLISDDMISKIQSNGSEVVFSDNVLSNSFLKEKKRKEKIKKIIKLPFLNFIFDSLLMWFLRRSFQSRIEKGALFFAELVSDYNIKKVILTTDRSTGVELSVAVLATRVKLELIVISFAISAGIESSEKLRKSRFYYYERKISWNSTMLSNGKIISFFKKFEKEIIESYKIKINNPWVLGAGFSDFMLVDSEREKERLVKMGGDREKYFVAGQVSHDKLFISNMKCTEVKKKVKNKYTLKNNALLLISVPQYYEHGLCERETHFSIINEMVNLLSFLDYDILLSLHPKMNRSEYEFISSDKNNVFIVDESLEDILPVCDFFISTYSSTVSWALLCSKKVIIIDHISLNYDDFFSEYNLPVLRSNSDLLNFFKEGVFLDSSFYNFEDDLVKKLSPFDGECTSKIAGFLKCENYE